jgi:hypothetical protein
MRASGFAGSIPAMVHRLRTLRSLFLFAFAIRKTMSESFEEPTIDERDTMIPSLYGFQVRQCPWMTVRKQVRFPRSKKRRMRKKWAKQQRNYATVPSTEIIQMMGAFHMHPETWQKLKATDKADKTGLVTTYLFT